MGPASARQPAAEAGQAWAEPTCHEHPSSRRPPVQVEPSRRWLPAICHGLLGCPPPTDRVVAAPFRSLDQRHGREPAGPKQLLGLHLDRLGLAAGRERHAVVAQHLRIDTDLRMQQRPKRWQGT
jgi:hypothetical protein